MSNDGKPSPEGPAGRAPAPQADDARSAEESLNEALSSLERMLEDRGRTAPGDTGDTGDGEYAIPLLDEVALPGQHDAEPAPDDAGTSLLTEDPELCRRIAERLASEVEVIVNTRMESAVREALDDAQRQLRNHLNIVLPELLEDLLHSSPPEDD